MDDQVISAKKIDFLIKRAKLWGSVILGVCIFYYIISSAIDQVYRNKEAIEIRIKESKKEHQVRDNRSQNRYDRGVGMYKELKDEIDERKEKTEVVIHELYDKWAEEKANNAYLRGRLEEISKRTP